MIGQRFGRLVVVSEAARRIESGKPRRWFFVHCDCGTSFETRGKTLVSGNTQSCGCYHRDRVSETQMQHGGARKGQFEPEYVSYLGMVQRCRDPNHNHFARYGGRGIQVCERWLNGEDGKSGYECFREDMGPRPPGRYSLDRWPDRDGNYEPGNCRWATDSEQQLNREQKYMVVLDGKRVSLAQAAKLRGIKPNTANTRVRRGMSPEEAIGL